MDQPGEMEPVIIRMVLPDPLGGLEGVHDIRQVRVGVRLVYKVVQLDEGVLDSGLEVVEL